MDATDLLLLKATHASAVLANSEANLKLIPLPSQLSQAETAALVKQGYCYCGVVMLADGKVEIAFEDSVLCKVIVLRAAVQFAQDLMQREQAPSGDSVDWLQKLHALEDPRKEFGPAS